MAADSKLVRAEVSGLEGEVKRLREELRRGGAMDAVSEAEELRREAEAHAAFALAVAELAGSTPRPEELVDADFAVARAAEVRLEALAILARAGEQSQTQRERGSRFSRPVTTTCTSGACRIDVALRGAACRRIPDAFEVRCDFRMCVLGLRARVFRDGLFHWLAEPAVHRYLLGECIQDANADADVSGAGALVAAMVAANAICAANPATEPPMRMSCTGTGVDAFVSVVGVATETHPRAAFANSGFDALPSLVTSSYSSDSEDNGGDNPVAVAAAAAAATTTTTTSTLDFHTKAPRAGLVECYSVFRTRGRIPPTARIGNNDALVGVRCDELPQRITFFLWDEEDPVTGESLGVHCAATARLTRDAEPALVSNHVSVMASHGMFPPSLGETLAKAAKLLGDLASVLRLSDGDHLA